MTYVLRQIHAPGKSAVAHHATAAALAGAALAGTMQYGPYLEWSDPDAMNGFGEEQWTSDLAKAKRFPTFMEAIRCWQAQSTIRPLRDDGAPNRPMTAYSVMPEQLSD